MKLKNKYFLLRHGQAISNVKKINSSWPEKFYNPLTRKGETQIRTSARILKNKNIDLIFSSDILRAKATAEIVGESLNLKPNYDKRLREYGFGIYNGGSLMEFSNFFKSQEARFYRKPKNGETYAEIKKRILFFLKSLEKKFSGKNILIVSHQVPIILLIAGAYGFPNGVAVKKYLEKDKVKNGEIIEL